MPSSPGSEQCAIGVERGDRPGAPWRLRRRSLRGGTRSSALDLLNFLVLQWFGVRLAIMHQRVLLGGDGVGAIAHLRWRWKALRWIWPLTGWWSPYRWIARR